MLDKEGIQFNRMGILVSADWFLHLTLHASLFRKLVAIDNVAKCNGRPGERMSYKLAWHKDEWSWCSMTRVVENAYRARDDDSNSSAEVS